MSKIKINFSGWFWAGSDVRLGSRDGKVICFELYRVSQKVNHSCEHDFNIEFNMPTKRILFVFLVIKF